MYLRASLVVLTVLNVGVALWWAVRPADSVAPPPLPPATVGVATLQLVESAAEAPSPSSAPSAATGVAVATASQAASAAATEAPAPRCLRLGAFASEAQANAAAEKVKPDSARSKVHAEVPAAASYRVMLPTVGDRQAAVALTKRIAAAGFSDYYVITQGEDNSIALGQYRSREGAERRQADLVAAGFPARLSESGGATASRWWLDVRARDGVDAATLQRLASTDGVRSLDCAALR